jgi:hypothetical protein
VILVWKSSIILCIHFGTLCSAEQFTLERYETEITKESTPFAIALAKHLQSIGAKMYGAFWCSHCNEQKEVRLSALVRYEFIKQTLQSLYFSCSKKKGRRLSLY